MFGQAEASRPKLPPVPRSHIVSLLLHLAGAHYLLKEPITMQETNM